MSDSQQSTAEHFRKTAGEIGWVARFRDIQRPLPDLAESTGIASLRLDCGVPGR